MFNSNDYRFCPSLTKSILSSVSSFQFNFLPGGSTISHLYPEICLSNNYVLFNPAKYSREAYINAWPEDLPFPVWTSRLSCYESKCEPKKMNLPIVSEFYDIRAKVLVNGCAEYEDYAQYVDDYLSGRNVSMYDYRVFDVAKFEFYTKLTPTTDVDMPVDPSLFRMYKAAYDGHKVVQDYQSLQCECEATSLLPAIKHGCLSVWHLINNTDIDEEKEVVERWLLEVCDLFLNLSIPKLVMTFIKVLREFIPLSVMLERIIAMIKFCVSSISGKPSPQQRLDDIVIEPTSFVLENNNFAGLAQFPADNVHIAAAISAVVVLMSSTLIGVNACKFDHQKSIALKISNAMTAIAKCKSGVYAVMSMFTDLTKWVHEGMKGLLMYSASDAVVSLIAQTTVPESDDCKKEKFYEYIEFVSNPQNLLLLQRNKAYQNQLEFVYKILAEILANLAKQDLKNVSISMRDYLKTTFTEVKKVRDIVFRRPLGETIRFTPFWVNIVGPSRCGKSVLQPFISNLLYKALKRDAEYEVPDIDHWQYAVNFSDKYLTDYNGEYLVLIDDFLQDAAPLGDRSSCLDMISWVSAIPYKTNQASLADKGIPFDSKIIISSSNDPAMNRKEIINSEALKLRQAMCIHFTPKSTCVPDPLLGNKKIEITLRDKENSTLVLKTYSNSLEFISDIVVMYKKHFKDQKAIIASRQVSDEIVKQMDEMIKAREVESTSLIGTVRCRFGLNPTKSSMNAMFAIIEQYDCSCDVHKTLNDNYFDFVAANVAADSTSWCGIDEFSYPFDRHQSYRQIFNNAVFSIRDKIVNLWQDGRFKLIASFVGAITLYIAGKAIMNSGLQGTADIVEDVPVEESAAQYSLKVRRLKPKSAVIPTSEDIRKESSAKQAQDLVNSVILKRALVCQVVNSQSGEIATALRVGGRALLLNHHFLSSFQDGDKFVVKIWNLYSGLQQTEQQFDSLQCHKIGTKDVALYNCDAALEMARNITNHFPDALVKVSSHKSIIVGAYPSARVISNVLAHPNLHLSQYSVNGEEYNTLDSYKTNCEVEKGMSGSILISCEDSVKDKILGIQACRNRSDGRGYFVSVTKQELKDAFEVLHIQQYVQLEDIVQSTSYTPDDRCPPNLGGNLEYLGTLPKTKYVRQQLKSKLIPSLVQEEPLTQLPSVLSDFSDRMDESLIGKSVIFRAVEGFSKPIGSIDRPVLRQALDDYKVEYDVVLDDPLIARRLLTDNEMINGVPGVINRVEMKTSPGYPYILERKNTTIGGKYEWFEEVTPLPSYGKTYEMSSTLKCGLEQREKYMLAGVKPDLVAYTCLKDETRPLEKIRTGKTRAFICLPLDYNLLIRKYFGAFVASLHKQAGKVASCVGIDPATQWKDLFDRLAAKNSLWEDFDYKNWDQHLHPELVMSIASLANYWYGDLDSSPVGRVRFMLLHDLVFTTLIVKDRLMRKRSGQCSGCAITAELNSIVHDLLMYYVWLKMNNDEGRPTTLGEFRHYIAYAIYGDDIIKAGRPDCPIQFNGSRIKDYMIELGMNITPGDKQSTEFTLKDPSQIFFLKRSFRRDGFYVKAPLRPDIVENIPQWIHKSDSLNAADATVVNCETALREAYMHGRDYFHGLLVSINRRIKAYNASRQGILLPVVISYASLDSLYRDCEYVCAGLEWKARPGHTEEH